MVPDHHIWKRVRNSHHSGAIRGYCKSPVTEYGRNSPLHCESCATNKKVKPAENPGIQQADNHLDFLDQIDLMIQEQELHKGQCNQVNYVKS